jgi:hypothetical protein
MPKKLARDHAVLVAEASSIALVTAVETTDSEKCALQVVEVLKGDASPVLPFQCRVPASGDWMTSFSDHTDEDFWKWRTGRLGIQGDCSLVPPAFEIGQTYLVLLTQPDAKQFEQIDSPQDKWLQFVRAQIKAGGSK